MLLSLVLLLNSIRFTPIAGQNPLCVTGAKDKESQVNGEYQYGGIIQRESNYYWIKQGNGDDIRIIRSGSTWVIESNSELYYSCNSRVSEPYQCSQWSFERLSVTNGACESSTPSPTSNNPSTPNPTTPSPTSNNPITLQPTTENIGICPLSCGDGSVSCCVAGSEGVLEGYPIAACGDQSNENDCMVIPDETNIGCYWIEDCSTQCVNYCSCYHGYSESDCEWIGDGCEWIEDCNFIPYLSIPTQTLSPTTSSPTTPSNTSPTTPSPNASPTTPSPNASPTTPSPNASPTPSPNTSPTTPSPNTSPTTPLNTPESICSHFIVDDDRTYSDGFGGMIRIMNSTTWIEYAEDLLECELKNNIL